MPIWLRKFTYQQIVDYKKRERETYEKSSTPSNTTATKMGDTNIPKNVKEALKRTPKPSSYKTKRSKK
jgi:hypothetical protein